ncbi:MAG TPA: hypothetical protein VL068_01135, partial [Microthrixaceae bacterium]|nr:hypothetical protein [Microthrixaceae bacterium]
MTKRLLGSYVLLAAFILVLIELPLGLTYASRAQVSFLADVERDARVLSIVVEEQAEHGDIAGVHQTVARYAARTEGRVVITDSSGLSVVDTSNGKVDRDFSDRPEFAAALKGKQDSGLRLSNTLGSELAYVAVPIYSDQGPSGALRISFPTDDLRSHVRDNWLRLGALSLFVLATAAAVGWFIARWATAPVDDLEYGAARLAS